jgi:RND family efflux transporter MFP subunit
VTAVSDTRLAFEVGGIVQTVDVALGEQVKRDQVLARLDPEPFELAVRDAEAGRAEATALRESARADYSRAERLFTANVASRQEYERATALRDSRESQVDAAEARLNLTRRDLRRSVLRAPFTGSISVREIDPAMKLASGQVVYEMDSGESGLRVEVQMPETLIVRVTQGIEVQVTFPSIGNQRVEDDGRSYPAVVSEVGTRAGTGNAFPVRADMLESPPGLRPGMTAEVTFTMAPEAGGIADIEGFLIPLAAVLAEADDEFSVFVFDPQTSTVAKRPIRSGGVRDNDIAVLGGLEEGDIIATAGVTFLREGQTVTLLDEQLVRNAP